MDEQNELAKAKWLIFFLGLFFVSCFMVWGEFMYLLKGKTAIGTITRVYEMESRSKFGTSKPTGFHVDFTFTESDGTSRTSWTEVGLNWVPPSNGKLEIQYTPGVKGRSRIKGTGSLFWPLIFFGTLAGGVIFWIKMSREAHEFDRPRPRKR